MPSKVGIAKTITKPKTITTMYDMHTFVASKCMWSIVMVLGSVMVLDLHIVIMIG